MTPEESLRFWENFRLACVANPEWRTGQAMMNCLATVAPELYVMVTGTICDPFYRNEKIPAFLDYIGEA